MPRNHFSMHGSCLAAPRRVGSMPWIAAILIAGTALVPSANAALYKWTDANGRVVYSDQPPLGDVKTETVRGPSAPANPNAVKELTAKEAELKKRQLDGIEGAKKSETQRADSARRAQMCTRAQDQIRQLSAEQINIARVNEKGEMVVMDDAQRKRERTEVEGWIRSNCAGV